MRKELLALLAQLAIYIMGVLGVLAIGCGSIAFLEHVRPDGFNSQAGYAIIGACTTIIAVLLNGIKGIIGQNEIKREVSEQSDQTQRKVECAVRPLLQAKDDLERTASELASKASDPPKSA